METFKLVKQGEFDEKGLTQILHDIPASYPGCSGTRTMRDNVADLKAAIASNNKVRRHRNGIVNYFGDLEPISRLVLSLTERKRFWLTFSRAFTSSLTW